MWRQCLAEFWYLWVEEDFRIRQLFVLPRYTFESSDYLAVY